MFLIILVFIECILWALANPAIKIALISFGPLMSLFLRFAIASLVYIVAFAGDIKTHMTKTNFMRGMMISLFTAAAYIIGTFGLVFTTSTTAGFLLSLAVIFTPFLSYYFLKTTVNKRYYPIIALVIIGMYFLAMNGGSFSFGLGELCAILSSFSLAVVLTLTSVYIDDIRPGPLATMQTVTTTIISLACALLFEDVMFATIITRESVLAIAYLALGATCAVYLIQNTALKKLTPVLVSLIFCSQPIFGALTSRLILGETLSFMGVIGGILITIGLIFASLVKEKGEL